MDIKEYMKTKELSIVTGLSLSSIYKLVSSNRIPHYKLNGYQLLFKRDEISRWLEGRCMRIKTEEEIVTEARKKLKKEEKL